MRRQTHGLTGLASDGLSLNAESPDTIDQTPARSNRCGATLARNVGQGIVLGALTGVGLWQLGMLNLAGHTVAVTGACGGIIGLTWARSFLWYAAASVIALMLFLSYTPVIWLATRGLERRDVLHPAPAVVVLGSSAFEDHTLSDQAQERALRGYWVLRQGYASRLVLTRPVPSQMAWDQTIRRQMADLKMDYPVDVVGPVANTHDEAIAVAALARKNHWQSIILVTHPWHMRRAAAAFEKAGLRVQCAPCDEGRFDWTLLRDEHDRLLCFRYWLHEALGYQLYRWRGWV